MRFHNNSNKGGNLLSAAFIRDLDDDYRKHGVAAIAQLRRDELRNYLKLVLSLVPRELDLEALRQVDDIDEEERVLILKAAREALAWQEGFVSAAKNQPDNASNSVDS
jgi:hypothetical protein